MIERPFIIWIMADALEDKINQWLLEAKREDLSADDLFSEVQGYYIEGIGGIDWAESVLAGTAAVLSLSPGHRRATDLHSALQISLITLGKQADDLFQSAESKFATGDLRRSIDLLKRHAGREIRYRQAKELLSHIKENIQSTVTADPNNTEAKLLLHEVEYLEPDLQLSGFRGSGHQ